MATLVVAAVLAVSRATPAQDSASPWYQDRGPQPRPLPEGETRIETALKLAALLRDGGVPGFYDGQFASVKERFDDLASIARDPDLNHELRVMAVMALQEAADGERLRAVLAPLLLPPRVEFDTEYAALDRNPFNPDDESAIARQLIADLSRHARFSLAKDGQPEAVLAKIRMMEDAVARDMALLLDPTVDSDDPAYFRKQVAEKRQVIFSIGYHYQQFDDYVHAIEVFERLCQNLPGHRETSWAHYNLACILALSGQPDSAMEHLRSAHAVGFTNVSWVEEDGDLASLRERPDFRALVAKMRNQEPEAGSVAPDAAPDRAQPQDG